MEEKNMNEALKALDGLPWIVKLLLTILYGVYGNILRLMRPLIRQASYLRYNPKSFPSLSYYSSFLLCLCFLFRGENKLRLLI